MKLSLRLIALLVAGITLVVVVAAWIEVRAEGFALKVELQQRSEIVADRLRDALEPVVWSQSGELLAMLLERLVARERIGGAVVYDTDKEPLAVTAAISEATSGYPTVGAECDVAAPGCGEFMSLGVRPLYAYSIPLHADFKMAGILTVFLDASAIAATSGRVWRNALLFMVSQVALIVLITYFVMRSAVLAPIA